VKKITCARVQKDNDNHMIV